MCSVGMLKEYYKYVERTKSKIQQLLRSSKAWWKLTKFLQCKAEKTSSIPPLKANGTWAKGPEEKAELFATTFSGKYILPPDTGEEELNLFVPTDLRGLSDFLPGTWLVS